MKEGQTYPGEITREELAKLKRSAQFCVSGLNYWPDDKPILIYHDEVELLDDLNWDVIDKLQERG